MKGKLKEKQQRNSLLPITYYLLLEKLLPITYYLLLEKLLPITYYLLLITYYLLLTLSSLYAQTASVEALERMYQSNSLNYTDTILLLNDTDTNAQKSAKNYYKALLSTDLQNAILTHSLNFSSFPREYYGQMSGLQLVTIDFINKEYDKALLKIDQIDSHTIPEILYWKAKIAQVLERYDEAITISQSLLHRHSTNHIVPQVWLVILESHFHKKDTTAFESNLTSFSTHTDYKEYKSYLLFLQAALYEDFDLAKSKNLYTQVMTEYPNSQYRVQAEDRLYTLANVGVNYHSPSQATSTNRANDDLPLQTSMNSFTNIAVRTYEELQKGSFYIQFGVFSSESAATNYITELFKDRIPTFHITKPVGGRRLWAVIQGPYDTIATAQTSQRQLNPNDYQTFVFKAE